jgi:hypothetical protein
MPCFCTTDNSFNAAPLGFLAPLSHFSTVLSLVFKLRANTGGLILFCSRSRVIYLGLNVGGCARQVSSKWHIVALSTVPT